ncbi:MAG: AI-2E family transporter [Armatimonadota bacterium]
MIPAQSRIEITIAVIWGVLIRLAAVGGILYFAYRVRFILVTVLLSAILALAVAPVVDWLSKRRFLGLSYSVRRFLVTLVVFLVILGAGGVGNVYLFSPVSRELSDAVANLDLSKGRIGEYMRGLEVWYKSLPPDLRNFLASQDFSGVVGRVVEGIRATVTTTVEWLAHAVEIIVIPVLAFYFVLDSHPLKREFMYLVPKRRVREALILLREAGRILQSYAICQIVLCLIAGVVVGVGLKLLGVQYALTMAMLAGITRAIPVIGPILGAIPIVLVSMLQSMTTALAVLVFFSILHIVESKLIMPKLLGYGMNLHPAIILIVLLIGSEFFGILGMFLAAPITAMLKCVYSFYMLSERTSRSLRASMAGQPPKTRPRPGEQPVQPTAGARP